MERLTRPTVSVDESAAQYMGKVIDLQTVGDRLLELVINGPTLNAVPKDHLRHMIRQMYSKLQAYENAEAEGRLSVLPCVIGDEVYGIRQYHGARAVRRGTVTEMCYVGDDMRLCIVVRGVCRGEWGKSVFATEEEAAAAIAGTIPVNDLYDEEGRPV